MAKRKVTGTKTVVKQQVAGRTPAKAKKGASRRAAARSGGDVREQLRDMSSIWDTIAAPDVETLGEIPDGRYRARIEDAVVELGGANKDRFQARFSLRIIGPTHEGRMVWRTNGLANDKGIEFMKRDLVVIGVDVPEGSEELPEALAVCQDKVVEIRIKNVEGDTGVFQNVFINKVVDEDEEPAEEEEENEEAGTDQDTVGMLGQTVSFTDDGGAEVTGEVQEEVGNKLTVVDESGNEWEVNTDDVTLVEDEETEGEAEEEEEDENSERKVSPKKKAFDPAHAGDLLGKQATFTDEEGESVTGKVVGVLPDERLEIRAGKDTWEVSYAECTMAAPDEPDEDTEEKEVQPKAKKTTKKVKPKSTKKVKRF